MTLSDRFSCFLSKVVFLRKLLVLIVSIWFPSVTSMTTRGLYLAFIVLFSLVTHFVVLHPAHIHYHHWFCNAPGRRVFENNHDDCCLLSGDHLSLPSILARPGGKRFVSPTDEYSSVNRICVLSQHVLLLLQIPRTCTCSFTRFSTSRYLLLYW